ncbi:MAG: hypothetical protein OXG35_13105 [Acidobacteria bacterium]|nr:hypothetical protein [Acidobacteriota bacterium]
MAKAAISNGVPLRVYSRLSVGPMMSVPWRHVPSSKVMPNLRLCDPVT